ncbi:oligosaccharide biosynthesis protein Alg14 [Prevotella sp. E9-3]|uniref:oligosaccharide biosynthesis protein Alg14 n=1 Tax=Prevotella sp. E9-3 TaxID=2913621 RepID=UPI001ED9F62D|nr:oligosaccharide biosynthesis protein Alg14 [Prevotella sp. E9-3]UKK49460.1 oligosaccharide biosynthesis protein Alg14 [Prevotella sp. E9-3]
MKRKVMAVASIGGHWIQLLRIARPMEEHYDMLYVSTHPKCATMVEGQKFYQTTDFSRSDAWRLIPSFFKAIRIILREKPDAIITTGAAPGLVFLMAGKLIGIKTIWIDSIANAVHLSASGRMASRFASRTYTQWKDLATEKIQYAGNVFGN